MNERPPTENLLGDADHESRSELAWQRLFESYQPRLLAFASSLLSPSMRGQIEPDDLTNEAWMCAVQHRSKFQYRGRDTFYRWLCVIIDRFVRDRVRKACRREALAAMEPQGEHDPGVMGPGPGTSAGLREQIRRVIEALDTLDDTYRIPLQMRHLRMRPPRAIALELGLKLNTLNQRLGRGLAQWRAALGEDPLAALG